jgi:topoisomerase-4 subunit A
VSEIEADAKRFGDKRRTLIEAVAPVASSRTVADEPLTVTVSRHGWIRSRQGHGLDATQFAWKTGDAPLAILETRTVHPVVVLDTLGRSYTIRASDIPGGRGDGVPVTTLIELPPGAKIAQVVSGPPGEKYLVAGTGGYGFVATLEDMVSRPAFRQDLHDAESGRGAGRACRARAGLDHVAALSSRGRLLVFPLAEMREVPRGRGVIIIGLDGEEKLVAVGLATASKVIVQGTNRLGRAVTVTIEGEALASICIGARARGRWSRRRSRSRGSCARLESFLRKGGTACTINGR